MAQPDLAVGLSSSIQRNDRVFFPNPDCALSSSEMRNYGHVCFLLFQIRKRGSFLVDTRSRQQGSQMFLVVCTTFKTNMLYWHTSLKVLEIRWRLQNCLFSITERSNRLVERWNVVNNQESRNILLNASKRSRMWRRKTPFSWQFRDLDVCCLYFRSFIDF